MAFGKKKKVQKEQKETIKVTKVAPGENVLYPPKEESVLNEIGIAAITVVVAFLLVGLIVNKKSYVNANNYQNNQHASSSSYTDHSFSSNDRIEYEENSDEAEMPVYSDGEVIIVEQAERLKDDEFQQEEYTAEYILEDSDQRYITDEEIADLDQTELSYARNEIYARHGRRFKDESLQEYFDSKSWYQGTISPDDFTEDMLSELEKDNVEKIRDLERTREY